MFLQGFTTVILFMILGGDGRVDNLSQVFSFSSRVFNRRLTVHCKLQRSWTALSLPSIFFDAFKIRFD